MDEKWAESHPLEGWKVSPEASSAKSEVKFSPLSPQTSISPNKFRSDFVCICVNLQARLKWTINSISFVRFVEGIFVVLY